MFIKTRVIRYVVISWGLTLATGWAVGTASFEGVVKDEHGKGLIGAEIRVKGKGGTIVSKATTDAKGNYATAAMPTGIYQVDLLVGSSVKASVNGQKALSNGKATALNFALTNRTATHDSSTKPRKYVWVPSQTGSHLGGHWVEDDGGAAAGEHVEKADGRMIQKLQQRGGTTSTESGATR